MSIELSPEVENVVRARAAAEGVSVNDLLARTFVANQEDTPRDAKERVRTLLAQWQASDNTPTLPPRPIPAGLTPTEALFNQWEAEDATLTDEERAQDEKFWEEFQQGIDAERAKAGMRTLF